MDLTDPAQRTAWRTTLGAVVRGRPVVCGVAPLAGLTDQVTLLRGAGALPPLLLSTGRGAGPVPGPDDARVVDLPFRTSATMTEELRGLDRLVRDLPAAARAAVDDYDPGGEAVWFVGPFIDTEPILGRPVLGGRPAAWTALEDKTVVDDIWDAVGHPRAPSRLVPVGDLRALGGAADELDGGGGTVWAGDARDGFNGGGDMVRWVVTDEERQAAVDLFAEACDSVRVMPFLEGVPCSIHGIVLPDGTAALRPVELGILRDGRHGFVYGGQGTAWQPPADDRAQMRELVRRTGEHLRAAVGYRGCFGIDGVLTADGFRPTELNPRMSGGVAALARSLDWAALSLLQVNLVAGHDPGVTVDELEAWAVPALDERPFCKAIAVTTTDSAVEPAEFPVAWDGERLTRTAAEEHGDDMTVLVGPTTIGLFARLQAATPPPGMRVGHLNAALMRLLDEELGTRFGAVTAAPDVRRTADGPLTRSAAQ